MTPCNCAAVPCCLSNPVDSAWSSHAKTWLWVGKVSCVSLCVLVFLQVIVQELIIQS
mgnify:CR=1 FL=1